MKKNSSTSSANKRVSTFIKNADHNAYIAYKQILKTESSRLEKSTDISTSRSNRTMKYPFLLTSDRFRWQNNKNRGETIELTGTMSRHKFKDSTVGKWEYLMNKSSDNVLPNKSVDKRTYENRAASLILTPSNCDVPLYIMTEIKK